KSYSTGRSIARKPLQSNHPSLFPALTRYPSRSRVLSLGRPRPSDPTARLHGLRILALRFFSVWGPGQRPDLALEAVAAASRRRPWTARLAP
ncbi:MAG: hypothetical protein NTW21_00205, partial [Verrucomicrobia bacterium]|nr:hypothetical protein [Verrucomicrobiota bacterium]